MGIECTSHQAHEAISFGEQIAQTLLEFPLLAVRSRRLGLPDFQHVIRSANPTVDLGTAVVDAGKSIFRSRDARERLDECAVGDLSFALDFLKPLAGLGDRRFAADQEFGLRSGRALDRSQFVCGALVIELLQPQLLVQSLELPAPGGNRFGERLALPAAELDLTLVVLDFSAQGQETLVSVAEDPLRFRELEAIGLDGQFSLVESRLEVHNFFAQRREAQLRGFVLLRTRAPLIGGD